MGISAAKCSNSKNFLKNKSEYDHDDDDATRSVSEGSPVLVLGHHRCPDKSDVELAMPRSHAPPNPDVGFNEIEFDTPSYSIKKRVSVNKMEPLLEHFLDHT